MKDSLPHKLGANRNEAARKRKKRDPNFSQSRDIREDRGARREKFVHPVRTVMAHPGNANRDKHAHPLLLTERSSDPRRLVAFKLNCPQAKSVCVAGTFNGWHPESRPLHAAQAGHWTTELLLEAGSYEYRFVVDGEWVDDPVARRWAPNGFGGRNCVLEIV